MRLLRALFLVAQSELSGGAESSKGEAQQMAVETLLVTDERLERRGVAQRLSADS